MPRKDPSYHRIADRIAAGEDPYDQLLPPLDFLILEELPKEGTLAMGLYPVGAMVADVAKKDLIDQLPKANNIVSGRVRTMKEWGLTVDVKSLGGREGRAWQITPRGEEVLARWKAQQS